MPRNALPILFEDARLIAVDKPAGVPSIPGRGEHLSVLEILCEQTGLPISGNDDPRLRILHRLDQETSGVLLLAKDRDAQRFVSHQFQNNTTGKQYLALVSGSPPENQGTIDAPLGVHPTTPRKMAVVRHGGRPARTDWVVEQRFRGLTLLRVFPRTGKTHQIRVHLRHVGLPLAIDPLYHPTEPGKPTGLHLSSFKRGYRLARGESERPLIDRLTLHAERLTVQHPAGQTLEVVAPLPKDLRAALNMLAKHAAL